MPFTHNSRKSHSQGCTKLVTSRDRFKLPPNADTHSCDKTVVYATLCRRHAMSDIHSAILYGQRHGTLSDREIARLTKTYRALEAGR